MCLSTVWPKQKQKEWLKKRKSPLIVYCKAKVRNGEYYPWVYDNKPYKKGVTKLPKRKPYITLSWVSKEKYRPYFHRFAKLCDAKDWGSSNIPNTAILKWRVYKKDITAIGRNGYRNGKGRIVIIARKLTLLGEVKPKKKRKKSA